MGNERDLIYNHLVVDGSFLLYSSIPYKPDTHVGPHMATYVFIKRVAELVERLRCDAVTVAWDGGIPANRKLAVPEYKSNRKAPSADQQERRDLVAMNAAFLREHILPHVAVRSVMVKGMEADDLIFGLCSVAQRQVKILSLDMDLSQLVSNKVTLVRPGKDDITETSIRNYCLDDKYGIYPRFGSDVVLFKALRGDPSDAIKPVMKPREVKKLWDVMLSRGMNPSPETARSIAQELNIALSNQFEANYTAVDLVRSGVAGDAIAAALAALATRPTFNENDLFLAFSSTGMNPAYLHSASSVLQSLSR